MASDPRDLLLMGCGGAGGAPPPPPPSGDLILDTISGANIRGAWSTRKKLRGAYAGAAFRVIRASDNAELDIGFDGSDLVDHAAMTTFMGASTLAMIKWYDQSTAGKNLVPYDSARRPAMVVSGGFAVARGNGSSTFLIPEGGIGDLPLYNVNPGRVGVFASFKSNSSAINHILVGEG